MPDHDFFELELPESEYEEKTSISHNQNVVILGANGSGKSRLGAWIERDSTQKDKVHRISAQKSLVMPESVQPKSLEEAEKQLLFGRDDIDLDEGGPDYLANQREVRRWNRNPVIQSLNDFQELMVYLFSEEFEESTQYRQKAKKEEEVSDPPTTKLDTVKRLWEGIFPHRRLGSGSGKINVYPPEDPDASYNAREMSDGERVAFYLIGECMAAPTQGIIVIDEPEIHLHRSIQSDLWDAVEQERDDCQFIYLTHDLDFASSREATRIWLKDYDGSSWDWRIVDEQEGIPEEVLLSILGSRRSILFVEGDHGSLDYHIYDRIYPEHTVTPCGGCDEVISATQAFERQRELHELDCFGLVDRDYRTEDEIESLKGQSIHVTQVSEVENLLLAEEVLRILGRHMRFDEGKGKDVDTRVQEAKETVLEKLEDEQERLTASITAYRIRRKLASFGPDQENREALEASFEETTDVNVDAIYQEVDEEVSSILDDQDYEEAIKIFDHKGLLYEVAPIFDLGGKEYADTVTRLLASGHDGLESALRGYVPSLEVDSEEEI